MVGAFGLVSTGDRIQERFRVSSAREGGMSKGTSHEEGEYRHR